MEKLKILVADNDDIALKLIVRVLNDLQKNLEIITCKNGLEALKLVKTNFFNLLITDVSLRGLSGLELVREIRFGNSTMKTIAYSSLNLFEEREKCLAAGFDCFVPQPEIDGLRKAVKSLLPDIACRIMFVSTDVLGNAFVRLPLEKIYPERIETLMVDNANQVLPVLDKYYLENREIDIVILDTDLPGPRYYGGPDAFSLSKAIKEKYNNIITGAISNFPFDPLKKRCSESEMEFLFDNSQTVEKLADLITKARFPL